MNLKILTIKNRSDFLRTKMDGDIYNSKSLILQKLFDKNLNNTIRIGYTTSKILGNAVKRNYAKRIMRVIVREILKKYGRENFYYVIIAKKNIFNTSLINLKNEFKELILKK